MNKLLLKIWGWGLILAIHLVAGSAWAAGSRPEERMTATVVEFAVRGDLDEQAGAILADLMMSAIANTGRFTLKDRLALSAAAKIAKAQELGSTGLLDPKTAAELGRLYGVEAVVTGGVYKLGDLITVTARLIDTRTASLLRSGQIQGKDIDTIQIKINELAAMITAPIEAPKTYALTVVTEPADANIRLLNHATGYQAGMQLLPGDYEVEATRSGYAAHKQSVRISDRDLTVTLRLESAKYRLTVRPEPADAQVRLLGATAPYQAGVDLPPGNYQVEVTRDGYVARKEAVRISDRDLTVTVALEPVKYSLTVRAEPADASIRLLNHPTAYQAGMRLTPGDYEVEATRSGYAPRKEAVRISDRDLTVTLRLEPAKYGLTVRPDPADAQIRLLGVATPYQAGVALPPGNYQVEVTREGYVARKLVVQIADREVTVPVALDKSPTPLTPPTPPPPAQYRLTVQADPPNAQVQLRGSKTAYKPGVELPPGSYTVVVSQTGYESKQVAVRIANSDVTVPVTLVKQAEPERYRLTVQADPSTARVQLRGGRTAYKPGVELPPGSYTIVVSQTGYESKQVSVRIANSDVTVPVTLVKQVEPEQYRLTVQVDPPNAQVQLRGSRAAYKPGVELPSGSYTIVVSQTGYESKQVSVRIANSDVTVPIVLTKQPEIEQYRLTVRATPSDARVRLVNSAFTYRAGVSLPPGSHVVEVTSRGYELKRVTVQIADSDVTLPVELEKIAAVTPPSVPAAPPTRAGEWRISEVQADSSLSSSDRSDVLRVLNGYVGRTVTRGTLLDGAMRVYQSTGVTLSFVVRTNASGSAELYARAARRVRRTYESSIPMMTPSQLENAGFGVSVE
jgi:hypothetical protein